MILTEKKYDGWTGVNNSDDEMNVDSSEMTDARNVLFTTFGEFFIRLGLMLPVEVEEDVLQLIYYIDENQLIYQTRDQKLYLRSTDENPDILIKDLETNDLLAYSHCKADQKIYFTSESDRLFSWDGTTAVDANTEIYGEVLTWYQNHMFLGGNVGSGSGTRYQNRIYISNMGDPKIWSANDWLPSAGEGNLVGLCELGDHVLVSLKDKSISFITGYGINSWRLTETNDATTNVDNSVGCAGKRAFCRVANELWFMDNQKNIRVIYQTDFDPYRKTYRSEKVPEWVHEISSASFNETQMLYFNDKVWVFAPDITGEKKIILVFDILAARKAKLKSDMTMGESWTRFEGEKWVVDGACVSYIGGIPRLLLANKKTVYLYGGNTDDGDPIESYAVTKNDDFGKYSQLKRYKLFFARADIDNQNDKVSVYASIGNSVEGYIGDLKPSLDGGILRDDDEAIGNFTLDADDLGILDEENDDVLGYDRTEATKLRYDTAPLRCTNRVIQHKFTITSTGPVAVSKVSSNFTPRNIK